MMAAVKYSSDVRDRHHASTATALANTANLRLAESASAEMLLYLPLTGNTSVAVSATKA